MAGGNIHLSGDQASIKYSRNQVGQSTSELVGFAHGEYPSTLSDNLDRKCGKRSDSKTPEILSTRELISAAGKIWDYASRPLASLRNEVNSGHNDSANKSEGIFDNLDREGNVMVPTSARINYLCADLRTASQSPKLQPILDLTKVIQKISVSEPLTEGHMHSSFWRLLQAGIKKHKEPWRQHGLASVEISCELENIYGWMKQKSFSGSNYPKVTEVENKISESCTPGDTICTAGDYLSGDKTSPTNKLASACIDGFPSLSKSCNLPSFNGTESETNLRLPLYSDYFLRAVLQEDSSISRTEFSNLYADYYMNSLVSHNGALEDCRHITDDGEVLDTERENPVKLVSEDSFQKEVTSSTSQKPRFTLAKQEHAFAGAFAGIFVSLCLHPVDTVKTVVQSRYLEQKSVFYIGRSIVSDRGLTGLYRGVTTKIASSAPISAIYTFTYESVKGALLPFFPKEYYSLVHCVAGGSASIATSFVFTPSEHIKHQMQVGTHYKSCWNAFNRIVRKGGLCSLYAGWGAVLCRNIPHSIIKFYTYESLKQYVLSSLPFGAQPNTLQTLFCGGLAGSTAAFFTTPFDVVKTRLQTQIPGSTSQYGSVIHALHEIGKHEGLNGLYRGLTPRLVMYISQGALFFASYEFFKKLFCLEMPQPKVKTIKNQQNTDDDTLILSSSTLPSSQTSSVSSASAPQKLHSLRS
ncbi:Mitochondrial substrate/solute carrier [Parasponia andersonii]|uniref:Mitochondrial substrate/solute carrier n=1 Tax=Parasponia andersonii TaxID=3476 RepID=A0A2P5CPD7_PARAD|nr:Mitochondrial substrate/solute carrier [Parasponia andersonii]